MADVHDPRTSVEGAAKNLLLLEDHLSDPGMRCGECILKHWLSAEAYLDEAASLERGGKFSACVQISDYLKQLRAQFESGTGELEALAGAVRSVHKACLSLRGG